MRRRELFAIGRDSRQLKLTALLLAMWLVVGCGVIVTPEVPPTPTLFVMQSLFAGDTCAPPCWFGLTAGVSTSEDVVELSHSLEDMGGVSVFRGGVVDANTGFLLDGQYRFSWGAWERDDIQPTLTSSLIHIQNGIVMSIEVQMNIYVTLAEAMRRLGTPEQIRFGGAREYNYFDLIFLTSFVRVSFMDNPDMCQDESIGESFWVDYVSYFAPIEDIIPRDLVNNVGFYNVEVPSEVWQTWSTNDWAINCHSALRALIALDLPYIPTLTPLPTTTIAPTTTP